MLQKFKMFLEMIRFSHTIFALPFALLSAAVAWYSKGHFQWLELVGILLCMVTARSAAMAFNRIADRHIDAENPRTANRHIPAGKLSLSVVWLFTLICSGGFIGSTTIFLFTEPGNIWPVTLSVPVLLFLCGYSYTKRFTSLAHYWLGASLLMAPVAAWIAIRGMDEIYVPLLLGLAVFFWVGGFDIIYACQDADFDRQKKLSSIPSRYGVVAALRIAMVSHFIMIGVLLLLAILAPEYFGIIFLVGVLAVAALLVYEHSLVSAQDLSRVNAAFFQVNAIVSLGLLLVVLLQLYVNYDFR